jgi:hypothetical protein
MSWTTRAAGALLVLAGTVGLAGCATQQDPVQEQPPELPVLLHQAWERTVSEHGATEAQARFAAMHERNATLKSALRSRDLQQVRSAQESLRAEQVRLIAATLGDEGPRQVLDAVAAITAELHERVQEGEREGRNVARLRLSLMDAEAVQAEAAAALANRQNELALELALQAVEVVTSARVAARSL